MNTTSNPPIDRPIFIVGCGRSGTTILFDLLTQHPEVSRTTGYPDGEDHDGWILHGKCAMAGLGNQSSARFGVGINGSNYCLHLTAADATPEIIASMRQYYWSDVLGEDPSKRVLNKPPHISNKIGYLLNIFPDARIIQIIRDCEPVVASWIAVMQNLPSVVTYWPEEEYPCMWFFERDYETTAQTAIARHGRFFPGGGSRLWLEYWMKTNLGIEKQMSDRLDQLCVVRYEDLVADPPGILRRLCRFCELSEHEFDVENILQNTASKHKKLIDAELRGRIAQESSKVRRYFGYQGGLPWHRRHPRLLKHR